MRSLQIILHLYVNVLSLRYLLSIMTIVQLMNQTDYLGNPFASATKERSLKRILLYVKAEKKAWVPKVFSNTHRMILHPPFPRPPSIYLGMRAIKPVWVGRSTYSYRGHYGFRTLSQVWSYKKDKTSSTPNSRYFSQKIVLK